MNNTNKLEKENKIRDIKNIDFGVAINEITSSMEIILTLFAIDDDPEIIAACKEKLKEGIDLLKKYGEYNKIKQYQIE